jgi:hypothetical protein
MFLITNESLLNQFVLNGGHQCPSTAARGLLAIWTVLLVDSVITDPWCLDGLQGRSGLRPLPCLSVPKLKNLAGRPPVFTFPTKHTL